MKSRRNPAPSHPSGTRSSTAASSAERPPHTHICPDAPPLRTPTGKAKNGRGSAASWPRSSFGLKQLPATPGPWTTWSLTWCGDCGANGDVVLGRPPWFAM